MTHKISFKTHWVDLLVLIILGFWSFFSYHNWISDSEFWPITLSGHFDQWRHNPGLIYKGLFHLSLSWIYLFDFDSADHIRVAKAFYSFLGVLSFYFFYRITRKYLDTILSLLVLLVILTSSLGFSQMGVIRSDFLVSFITMVYLLIMRQEWDWKRQFFAFLVYAVTVVFVTPKGIYLIFSFWIYLLLTQKKQFILKCLASSFAVVILALGALTLIDELFLGSQIFQSLHAAWRHHSELRHATARMNDWWFLKPFLMNDIAVIVLMLFLFITAFLQRSLNLATIVLAGLLIGTLALHQPLLPFFVGSYFMIIAVLLFPALNRISVRRAQLVLLAVTFVTLLRFEKENYFHSNEIQIYTIKKISQFLDKNSYASIDGLGLFPRVKKVDLSYLGPSDATASEAVLKRIIKTKPDFIVYTGRFTSLEPGISRYLTLNYQGVGSGYWLRNDLNTESNFDDVLSGFLFTFRPISF